MKIQGRGLVFAVAASAAVYALLHLFYAPLFLPSNFFVVSGRQRMQWNAVMEEKLVMEYLSMLVEGEDQRQLNLTGFSCQKDVHTHVCLSSNQVRIQAQENQETAIYQPYVNGSSASVSIKPYAMQEDGGMDRVTPVHIFYGTIYDVPPCDLTHNVPAVVFSSSGFAGNLFHEFDEIIVPLFLTCRHFNRQVQFVITDLQPFLVEKYRNILTRLSDYDLITLLDRRVHCFPGAVVGLKYHSILAANSTEMPKGYDMIQFRKFLRETYSLKISKVRQVLTSKEKPVLLLISRRSTRVFLNEDEMVTMITSLGYNVIVADPKMTADVDKFSKVVNQCSVIIGAHGAGLTNLVFLPASAVVVQVVPLGLDWASNAYFGEPVKKMDLNYLSYKIEPDESSLLDVYGRDHPVITDPMTVYVKGYEATRAIYVDGQNLKINLQRFKKTLIQVQKLLISSVTTDKRTTSQELEKLLNSSIPTLCTRRRTCNKHK